MSKKVESDNENRKKQTSLQELLEKNLKVTEDIHEIAIYVKKYIFWQKIFTSLKVLIFVIPLIIGIIYLPPLLNQIIDKYKTVLEIGSKIDNVPNLEKMTPDILKYIKK